MRHRHGGRLGHRLVGLRGCRGSRGGVVVTIVLVVVGCTRLTLVVVDVLVLTTSSGPPATITARATPSPKASATRRARATLSRLSPPPWGGSGGGGGRGIAPRSESTRRGSGGGGGASGGAMPRPREPRFRRFRPRCWSPWSSSWWSSSSAWCWWSKKSAPWSWWARCRVVGAVVTVVVASAAVGRDYGQGHDQAEHGRHQQGDRPLGAAAHAAGSGAAPAGRQAAPAGPCSESDPRALAGECSRRRSGGALAPHAIGRAAERRRDAPLPCRKRTARVIADRAMRPVGDFAGSARVTIRLRSGHSRLTSSLPGWTQESIQAAPASRWNHDTWSSTSWAPGEERRQRSSKAILRQNTPVPRAQVAGHRDALAVRLQRQQVEAPELPKGSGRSRGRTRHRAPARQRPCRPAPSSPTPPAPGTRRPPRSRRLGQLFEARRRARPRAACACAPARA